MSPIRRALSFFALLLLLLAPCLAQGEERPYTQPQIWSLPSSWWSELVADPELSTERTQSFLKSLQDLAGQIPTEQQENFLSSLAQIENNIAVFLDLQGQKGWVIQEAPSPLEVYNVDAFIEAVQDVYSKQSRLRDARSELQRLSSIYQRSLSEVDTSYQSYLDTTERSLQRIQAGLKVILSKTTRGIIEERIRLEEERVAGVERALSWSQDILTNASARLRPQELEPAPLEADLIETGERILSLQEELKQFETQSLVARDQGIERQLLQALIKRLELVRLEMHKIQVEAQLAVRILYESETAPVATLQGLVDHSGTWLSSIQAVKGEIDDWRTIIRREQDAAERSFLKEENGEHGPEAYRSMLTHQRTVQEALVAVATVELETLKARSLADLVRKRALGQLAWIRAVGNRLYIAGEHALSTAQQWFSFPLFRINERPVSLLHILRSLLILFFAFFFSSQLQKGLRQWSRPKRHISNASLYAFNRVAHYSIVCIGVIWALSALGMEFQNLFILAGALSVGIGFGLQGIANNFLSGLIVLFDRKLRVGDFIELADGAAGHITEVNVQNTVVRTRDGYEILVPNSDILTRQLTNWTLRDYFIRVRIPFGVAYGSDKERVVEVVEAAARRVDSTILDHKKVSDPRCRLIGFGNNSLDFELRVWVDFRQSESARGALRSSYCWEIDDALREAGIEIPFPQLDLHLRSGFKTDG